MNKTFRLMSVVALGLIVTFMLRAWTNSEAANVTPAPDNDTYQPIPPGFDFPADEAELLKLRDTGNVSGMRKHAWMVFAGLTQPTAGGEAVWETWFSQNEVFASGPGPQGLVPRKPQRRFQNPDQFRSPSSTGGPNAQAVGASLLSFVLFNKDNMKHIRANKFYLKNALTNINNGFNASHTPTEKREITPFPKEAVSLKIVWWLVKNNGLTPMPIWDGKPTQPDQMGNDYPTWARFVAVDPSRSQIPDGEKSDIFFEGNLKKNSHVVPLANFYSFQISQNEIAAVQSVLGPDAQVGDYAAVVAMHVTTKEIPDWVWATFWWHDKPSDGPFSEDRPSAVPNVWRNYLMDVTFSADTPKESDGTPNVCFNPWLEARFSGGLKSNCMACHQRSVWTKESFLPITRGGLPKNDQYFVSKTKLDFLWSIAFQSK